MSILGDAGLFARLRDAQDLARNLSILLDDDAEATGRGRSARVNTATVFDDDRKRASLCAHPSRVDLRPSAPAAKVDIR